MPWKSFSSVWPSSRSGRSRLKRKVKGALVYPIMVVFVAVGILTFIMIKIVPAFIKIFDDFDDHTAGHDHGPDQYLALRRSTIGGPDPRRSRSASGCSSSWSASSSRAGMGWDMFMLKMPIFGQLVEKNIVARTTRTLGTLVSSGVPILEALNITRETSGNAVFENMFYQESTTRSARANRSPSR